MVGQAVQPVRHASVWETTRRLGDSNVAEFSRDLTTKYVNSALLLLLQLLPYL